VTVTNTLAYCNIELITAVKILLPQPLVTILGNYFSLTLRVSKPTLVIFVPCKHFQASQIFTRLEPKKVKHISVQ
jgi:hypothetical protein